MKLTVKRFVTLAIVGMLSVLVCGYLASANAATEWSLEGKTVVDLSHVQDNTMPADPALKLPTLDWFARVGQGEGAYWNLEVVSYCPHTGTHMDAPFHVNSSWKSFESMDPTVLFGPAVVLNVKVPSVDYSITAADLRDAEAQSGPIQPGDAVLVHTGHDVNWPNKAYIQKYPIFTKDAAEYLVAKKARFVGMETISPDGPNTITHQILMGGGVMIVENLTNIDQIGQPRCTIVGTFPNVKGASGEYVRLLAVKGAIEWSLEGKTVVDLSHVQDNTMPADPALKLPALDWFARVGQGEGAYWNLEVVSYCPHTGTHIDAPFHVNSSWKSFESMDPTVLFGPAVVLDVKVSSADYSISAADLKDAEAQSGPIQPGDAVLVHTGHDANWPNKAYIEKYPIFTKDAAEYLVAKKARFVGMETISPDGPNTITHQILMGGGVMIVENLTNIDQIGQPRCTIVGTFPNVKGASGEYVRLLAVK